MDDGSESTLLVIYEWDGQQWERKAEADQMDLPWQRYDATDVLQRPDDMHIPVNIQTGEPIEL